MGFIVFLSNLALLFINACDNAWRNFLVCSADVKKLRKVRFFET